MRSTRALDRRYIQSDAALAQTRRITRGGVFQLLVLFAGLLAVALPTVARGQTEILVDSNLDQPDADVVDDICDADAGPAVRCTLRAAIMQANVTPGADTISWPFRS